MFLSILKGDVVISLIFTCLLNNELNMSHMNPPIAKKVEKELIIHDDVRLDNYYWLNDKEDKEVISYLEAENSYYER